MNFAEFLSGFVFDTTVRRTNIQKMRSIFLNKSGINNKKLKLENTETVTLKLLTRILIGSDSRIPRNAIFSTRKLGGKNPQPP